MRGKEVRVAVALFIAIESRTGYAKRTRGIGGHGSLSMFTPKTYEAANVLLDAITRAYEATGGKVTRESVNEALKTTKYTGILGFPIEFKPNGDLVSSGVFIGKVEGGKFVQVKEANY
jgi:ABC-type branched-subunit amino acid transport system substrate-binding protein